MHDRRREHGRGAATSTEATTSNAGVGKTTLTQSLAPHPHPHADPFAAIVGKVKKAALDGDAPRAIELMLTTDPPEQEAITRALGPEARHRFARHMPTDIGNARPTRDLSKILFDHTPASERSTLELFFEARFRLQIGNDPMQERAPKFDALGLRRLWHVFEELPAGHVAHNWAVANLDRYRDTNDPDRNHAHGAFAYGEDGPGGIDLSYRKSIIKDGGTTDHDRPGDPLHGVNRFDEVARHEIGHAVDRELGLPSFKILRHTDEAGHWHFYHNREQYRQAAEEMVIKSNGPIHRLPHSERSHVIDAMVMSMENCDTSHFLRAIDHAHEHGDVKTDAVYHAMIKGLAKNNPWLDTKAIDGRHYHQAYAGTPGGFATQWVSYREEAWKNHRVSEYQFRAIQEWFAEAYSAFYTPVDEGQEKGALLKQKLPETHKWFVANVDNKHAFSNRSKAAHKKDTPPKKP